MSPSAEERPVLSALACRLCRKPRVSATALTRATVSSRRRWGGLKAREAVEDETPAAAATSAIVGEDARGPRAAAGLPTVRRLSSDPCRRSPLRSAASPTTPGRLAFTQCSYHTHSG